VQRKRNHAKLSNFLKLDGGDEKPGEKPADNPLVSACQTSISIGGLKEKVHV